jgi:dTDP-glucose 4,6-dehydratase
VNILVTGGLGFIGVNFCLLAKDLRPDWNIRIFDSFAYAANNPAIFKTNDKLQVIRGDIRDSEALEPQIRWCDAVINFAAESHNDNSLARPTDFVETNILGTMVIAGLCLKYRKRFHQVSTDEVYGDTDLNSLEEFTLDSKFNPSSPYSSSKAAADLLLMAWHKSFGLAVTISHSTNNFGKYQNAEKFIPRMIHLIKSGEPPALYGNGSNIRDWINVSDHCLGLISALESNLIGSRFHFGAGDRVRNIEVVENLLVHLEAKHLPILFVEDRPAHDKRYALSYEETASVLGWAPTAPKLLDSLAWLCDIYPSSELT